jgi:hypothetical protein
MSDGRDIAGEGGWLRRFFIAPPSLQGGISLSVQQAADSQISILHLIANGSEAWLRAVPLSQPYPSALRRLRARRDDFDAVIVSHIPPGLQKAAEELGVSYLDPRGYGRIVQPGFFYFASSSWPRSVSLPQRRSPFAPKASRIVRALLAEPQKEWGLSEIARSVDLDPGNAYKVLGSLVDQGLVGRHEGKYVLEDPGTLLEAWADQSRPPREQVRLSIQEGLDSAVQRVRSRANADVVVSGEFAAEILISYLPASSAIVYLFAEAEFEEVLSWERREVPPPVQRRFIWVRLADEGVRHFASEVDGLPLVSPQQLYVDLSASRGRGREAAEEIRRRLLKF